MLAPCWMDCARLCHGDLPLLSRLSFFVWILGWSPLALAGGGMLSTRFSVSNEFAFLHHPQAIYKHASTTPVYLPRFGVQFAYGLANWLELAVGADMSLSRAVAAHHVGFQGIGRGDLYADYSDVSLPVQWALRYDVGTDYNGLWVLGGGCTYTHWHTQALLSDDLHQYPINKTAAWYGQWFARTALLLEWRPIDWFALQLGPYGTLTSGGDVHAGLWLQVDGSYGFGPSF